MTVFDSKMFLVTHIDQAIIPSPIIRMNDTIRVYFASNYSLKRLFSAIWDDFCVNFASSLENSKHNRFSSSSTIPFALDTTCTKIGFINFNFSSKRRCLIT